MGEVEADAHIILFIYLIFMMFIFLFCFHYCQVIFVSLTRVKQEEYFFSLNVIFLLFSPFDKFDGSF